MKPVAKDFDAQSTLAFVSVLPERFHCDHGLREIMETRSAEKERLQENAHPIVLDLIDRILKTISAYCVTREALSCFRLEVVYGGYEC